MKKNYLHERKAHLPFVLALGLIAAPIPALAETEEEFYKLKYCSTVVYMVPRA